MSRILKANKFSGIDNVQDKTRLSPDRLPDYSLSYPLDKAENVYIDDTGAIVSRPGYDKVVTGRVAPHSGWSNGSEAYFAEGSALYRFHTDYSLTAIMSGLNPGARVYYCQANSRIYLSDSTIIGYLLDSVFSHIPNPGMSFKRPLPAGRFLTFYKGRIYVAVGKVLYYSDPLKDFYDTRMSYRQFADDISMVVAVDRGLYVADSRVWFLAGDAPEEFKRDMVSEDRPISGTATTKIEDGNLLAVWVSKNGIHVGNSTGTCKNVKNGTYRPGEYSRGCGIFVRTAGVDQYQASLY